MSQKLLNLSNRILFAFFFLFITLVSVFPQTNIALGKSIINVPYGFDNAALITNGNTSDYATLIYGGLSSLDFTIDLGAVYPINQINAYWPSVGMATSYQMQTSSDNSSWTNFGAIQTKGSPSPDYISASANARYVKMHVNSWYSNISAFVIGEVQVIYAINQDISGNLTVGGTSILAGTTTLNNTLTVAGTSTLNGAATLNNTLTVASMTTLTGPAHLNNTLMVTGATTIGATSVPASLTVNGGLYNTGGIGIYGAGLDGSPLQMTVINATSSIGSYFDFAKNSNKAKLPVYFKWRGDDITASAMTILGNGKIAIGGNASPTALLTVNGVIHATGIDMNGLIHSTMNGGASLSAGQGPYFGAWNNLNGGGLGETDFINQKGTGTGGFAFYNSSNSNIGTVLMYLDGSGNAKVTGTVYATKVIVEQTVPTPDYVFEKNYKLKSLSETEAYIRAHKHLEGMPSAIEVKDKGIDVAEMNAILLKKIEEMTLLMIEEHKSIENLEKENGVLKAKVESILNK